MPKVRLAGTVRGERDPNREIRARLLYNLFRTGWDIYNSNGDQRITLCNIERKIIESDAFVFTPGATLEDLFKAVSIFVGYQTLDRHLHGKPTILLNTDESWDGFYSLLSHLNRLGTVLQEHERYLLPAACADEVMHLLESTRQNGVPVMERERAGETPLESYETPLPAKHRGNVCVFCSASISDPSYLLEGWEFGRSLARAGLGCVSGAGKSGIMGEVVRGAVEAGGWTGGSNVPHIIELEGLPNGLSSFWLRPDIYTRMEIMIERSDAFVIFPGGSGTVQEMIALMIFKHQGHPSGAKPVVVYNRRDDSGIGFWDPLIALLRNWCDEQEFTVVEEFEQILPTVERLMETRAQSAAAESSVR
ncbi:MAG: LOG family protein [Luteolibacter sp.]